MATGSCGVTISASPLKLVGGQWQTKRGNPPSRQQQRRGVRRPITSQLELRPPPYPLDGLEPYMSRRTVELHWGRHCRAHLDTLNRLIAGSQLDTIHDLHQILLLASSSSSYNKNDSANATFNHAAHLWNHDFFWQSMTAPQGGSPPPSPLLLHLIRRDFGSFDAMLRQFNTAASTHFGSGWVWLLYKANRLNVPNAVNPCPSEEDNKLVITTTPNAVNPLLWDYSPLLAVDVWEHAYYLDYENRRADYVSNFMEKLVSWEVVSSRLERAIAQAKDRMREDETRKEEDDKEMAGSEAVEMHLDRDNDD